MAWRAVLFLVLFAGLWPGGATSAAAADMFGRPEAPASTTEAITPQALPLAVLPVLPSPMREVVGRALAAQSRLNAELRGALQDAKRSGSWRPAFTIVVISFLYGVFHAVGPGHGKVIVGSYFLTRRARLLHGFAMSGAAALVQALSAVLLVSLMAAVLEVGSRQLLSYAANLETASYAVIVVLGLWMALGVLRPRPCCEHAHQPGHDHDTHQPGAHTHGHDASPRSELTKVLATGAAVGLRPCSGAILVLLFTLANEIYPIGILATFAMAVGVAITVSAVSLATFGVHRSLASLGEGSHALADRMRQVVAMGGALAITLFGVLQLIGIWTGVITPMAG